MKWLLSLLAPGAPGGLQGGGIEVPDLHWDSAPGLPVKPPGLVLSWD